ncbi:ABC transporter ATP-binding protein [Natrialba swarupiae]|uniref:Molybdate/tungstate import ATP-binding protein WtpC n=1 Tax=Natrialba swarupiae TaxID=2448032 RepID=A0A5D5AQ15_9EURY|nr:ABC transporter ATP-binding protein [Natrialba swarupiae]TYT61161.1 ABC transporter ATP-binding protein [Natrialba swarupiae]
MILELDQLTHRYGDELAVDDVSFGLDEGELVAVLGPSGCGKTTLVQAIAGHVQPTAGRVVLRDRDVTGEPPEDRHVGIVFQQSTLYPHMTVNENVAYGLAARGIEPTQRDKRVREYLELVALSEKRDAHPSELSGGQRRRVEVARALAPQPDVLLLDEPLSALDRQLRERLRDEIARIQAETGVTTLFVTHDQEEAMALADRLIVMNDGRVSGSGAPRVLYESPPTPFVASFLGRSNTFPATVVSQFPPVLRVGDRTFSLPSGTITASEGTAVTCHVRPDRLSVSDPDATDTGSALSLPGEVVSIADVGRRYDVRIQAETGSQFVVETMERPPVSGEAVTVELPRDRITIFESATHDSRESTPRSDTEKYDD